MLLRREAAGVDEHARIGGPAGRARQSAARAAGWNAARVDAERLQRDALDAPVEQVGGHAAARREHEIEAGVDMARIALAPLVPRLGRGARPAASRAIASMFEWQ